jgi:putative intracellular protease/amidase
VCAERDIKSRLLPIIRESESSDQLLVTINFVRRHFTICCNQHRHIRTEQKSIMGKDKVVRIGVFIPTESQVLDMAPIDIFACMSHEYLSLLSHMLPSQVIDLAPSVQIHYIGSVQPGEAIPLTANQRILATNHYSDAEVAPGKLDIVLVPGPDPETDFQSKEQHGAVEWLKSHAGNLGTDILSICTGVFLCGAAGLLEGRVVCGPRGLQDGIRSKFGKNMTLKGAELRWVQDGNFWSSGKHIDHLPALLFTICSLSLYRARS